MLLIGLVRSPISTTVIQVASRLLLVHLIVAPFPEATTSSPFYASMLVAWSVTEVIRYAYFFQSLRGVDPGFLTWLRYNTFFVLYPMGISSEVVMIWKAKAEMGDLESAAVWAVLAIYVPGK